VYVTAILLCILLCVLLTVLVAFGSFCFIKFIQFLYSVCVLSFERLLSVHVSFSFTKTLALASCCFTTRRAEVAYTMRC